MEDALYYGYLWDEGVPQGWFGVMPPMLAQSVWRGWLSRQDATKRKYIGTKGKFKGFWLIRDECRKIVEDRFSYLGWNCIYGKPPYLNMSGDEFSHFGPGDSGGIGGSSGLSKDEFACYSFLHLTPSAPREVVDAAYRALQKLHHTDCGGDEDKSKEINVARDKIYKQRGW